jgi:hypothetical protein
MFYDWDWRVRNVVGARTGVGAGSALVLRLAGVLEGIQGRIEAIALCRRALEQDPLSAAANHSLAFGLHAADRLLKPRRPSCGVEPAPQRIAASPPRADLARSGRGEGAAEAMREPEEGYRSGRWRSFTTLGHSAESGV